MINPDHAIKPAPASLPFESIFYFPRFANSGTLLTPYQAPWPTVLSPLRNSHVVLFDSPLQVRRHSNIKTTFGILNHVDPGHTRLLVAGAGFEPAVRQPPDYEP